MKRVMGTAGAALAVKVLTGVAVAAAAVTMAGAATTGSLNPQNWGSQVTDRVTFCKDTLRATGTRGIGQCVSEFARTHGQQVASEARHHGGGDGNGNGNGHKNKHDGNGNGQGSGQGQGDVQTQVRGEGTHAPDPHGPPSTNPS